VHRSVVTSTTFSSVGYDPDGEVLEVEFVNGRIYQYASVPRDVYEDLRLARSMGRYYLDHIKDRFAETPL
jgi:hypothetical protein